MSAISVFPTSVTVVSAMSAFLTSFRDPSHGESTERGEETDDDALALDQHQVAHDGGDAGLPVVHVAQVGCRAHPLSVRVIFVSG